MILALYILAYFVIGSAVSFSIMLIAYKFDWEENNRDLLTFLAWIAWPVFIVSFLPFTASKILYSSLDKKAKEIMQKR